MTMMSDLSEDLVEEILYRVSITSLKAVRSTCKQWNRLSKDRILCRGEVRHGFLGFIMKKYTVSSLGFDLNGIHNKDVNEPSMKQIDMFKDQVKISQVSICDGLLLLVTKEVNSRLVVWNTYLGKAWCILKPKINHFFFVDIYALGYDNNRNHKVLRYSFENYQIYDFRSSSWRVLDVVPEIVIKFPRACHIVSLKGNTYFFFPGEKIGEGPAETLLQCFDFTRERFGSLLPLPIQLNDVVETVALSLVRYEQLAVLIFHRDRFEMEIWVTTKIEPNAVSWRNFLRVATTHFNLTSFDGSFFIDQEKKLAVIFDRSIIKKSLLDVAYIIGENGYLRMVDLGKAGVSYVNPFVYSYAPSLVQLNQGQELLLITQKQRSPLLTSLFDSILCVSFIIISFSIIYYVFF